MEEEIINFIQEYQDINGTYIHTYNSPPTPVEFLRNCVHPNRPAVIKNAISHWPALKRWSNDYFREKMGESIVTVATTPNGYADAVTYDPNTDREYFVLPHEESMPFNDFLDIIQGKRDTPHAHYISLQNDSLHTEFAALKDDIDEEITWCSEALGKKPDAVNFWMGNDKSITSLHKDPYENCYAVIRGEKTFVLLPPSEYYCLHESNYPTAIYSPTMELTPLDPPTETPWIPVDPLHPNLERFPRFKHARPIVVKVQAGDILYLPALWFHQVLQHGDDGVIAVNAWYDMDYRNTLYPSMSFVRGLVHRCL
ncbi:Clavaminate synthase-like protein [Lichtheimia hyalospora FSU 10163]|nr:Clavaminate synthase-like protein [Lichtheimia hyalospora FSU 10163]